MPTTTVVFYKADDGTVPVLEWLIELHRTTPRAYVKCVAALIRLRNLGHELRRPEADTLRNSIIELRIRLGHVNYRLLYAIHGRVTAIIAHALTKEDHVPNRDIDLAVRRVRAFEQDAARHTYVWEETDSDDERDE